MLPVIQLLLVLACLYFGARRGGVALGVISGIGLAILVLIFQMKPAHPPPRLYTLSSPPSPRRASCRPLVGWIFSSRSPSASCASIPRG